MDIITAIVLGLIQGITEWLPVSSTGHLVFSEKLMNIDPASTVMFDLILHLATLLSVTFFLRRELAKIVRALLKRKELLDAEGLRSRRLGLFAVAAVLPLAVVGLIASYFVEDLFTPTTTAVGLLITGVILWVAEMPRFRKGRGEIDLKSALAIGCAQAASIVPGISRSGSTISAGCYLGFDRELVAVFSFLMSIPAIVAALAYGAVTLDSVDFDLLPMAAGAVTAGISGVIALRWLFVLIKRFRLRIFAGYCWAVGGLALILLAYYEVG